MLDLETMDTKVTSIVLSIAAIAFDPQTGKHLKPVFYKKIDIDSFPPGFTLSGETLKWWMEQSDEARTEAFCGYDRVNIKEAMEDFIKWCLNVSNGKTIKIWSHGATFDIPIVTYILEKYKLIVPWKYTNARDTRTFYEIYGVNINKIGSSPVEDKMLPAHHPLADCARQIEGIRIGFLRFK